MYRSPYSASDWDSECESVRRVDWADVPLEYYAPAPKVCMHEWKSVLLLTTHVFDCVHCGIKKEQVEE